MRRLCLIAAATALLSSGCSFIIAGCGKDLEPLTTRAQFIQQFGEPVRSGQENGTAFEDFHTHQKIAENDRVQAMGMCAAMTLGLGEFIEIPIELWRAGRQIIMGGDIRVTHDQAGKVIHAFLKDPDAEPQRPSTANSAAPAQPTSDQGTPPAPPR